MARRKGESGNGGAPRWTRVADSTARLGRRSGRESDRAIVLRKPGNAGGGKGPDFKTPLQEIVLDLDATDDPLHGHQEGRFFHGYYDCYCYLPLYVFCGRHLLAAKLRRSNIDASAGALDEVERIVGQIRARWPRVKIVLRADSGFARDALMTWCEANGVDYVFGLARNERLVGAIAEELAAAAAASLVQDGPARCFADLAWRTLDSWSRERRVVAKAEHLPQGPNPRFVVTSLPAGELHARTLYEDVYCARGEVENACMDASRSASRFLLRSGMRDRLLLCIRPAEPDALWPR